MADQKITALDALTTPASGDLLAIVDDVVGTPVTKKITINNLGLLDGWIPTGTFTYASADDPTYTFTVAAFDATTKYSVGMKVKLTQTTDKYFIITKVVFDDPGSTITIYGGTDYDLANATITSPHYSTQKAPLGFPLDPDKWSIQVTDITDRSQSNPAQNTWYNPGSISINIPIGIWEVYYSLMIRGYGSNDTAYNIHTTLSTTNNSESGVQFTMQSYIARPAAGALIARDQHILPLKVINLTTKDTYYLNVSARLAGLEAIGLENDEIPCIIKARSAYL